MRKMTYILLLSVGLCHGAAQAAEVGPQNETTELEVVTRLADFDRKSELNTANAFFRALDGERFTDGLVQFTADTPIDTLRQQVWYWAAEYYYDLQQYAQAERYGLKALPLCQVGDNRVIEGDCLSLLSLIYVRQGEFDLAAQYAKQTNQLDLRSGDVGKIASSYNTLAGIYMSARQPEEAEKYIQKALDYARKDDNSKRMAVLLGMASEVYQKLGRPAQSLDYATRAYELEQQLGRTDKAAIRQAQRASALISLGRYGEAKKALSEAIPLLRRDGNRHSLGIACNQMGILLHAEGNDSTAVRYYDEALTIFTDQHDLYNESQSRKGLYNVLRQTDPTQAMLHNDRYNELRDSLYDKETGMLLTQYAAEYDYGNLQASLEQQQRSHRRTLLFGGAAILLLVVLAWMSYLVRSRRQRRQTAELMQEIDRISRQYEVMQFGRRLDENENTETPSDGDAQTDTEAPTDSRDGRDREFVLRVVEAVDAAIARHDVSVGSVASALGMSTATLRRRIVEATGDSPKTVFTAIQMQKACTLLTNHPDLSVADVALRCGFGETANFTRAFKRTFGLTPTQFARGERPRVGGGNEVKALN